VQPDTPRFTVPPALVSGDGVVEIDPEQPVGVLAFVADPQLRLIVLPDVPVTLSEAQPATFSVTL
jgi:hypothetical protein